ncbi:hypothetical protein, partial [Jatrophihabitans sp.]|uniref:hypothetical protein n=1 Tax=Jatrophihabitans sp. TaxID=1932789 RepID=UPI0030C708EE|nr:hypothetical protein [Jatrophihabitans sp.]
TPSVAPVPRHYVNSSEVADQPAGAADCGGSAGSGFALSVAEGAHGSPTPLTAVQVFVATGGVTGYGTPATEWTIVPGDGRATALAPGIALEVTQLDDRSWLVLSGEHCG